MQGPKAILIEDNSAVVDTLNSALNNKYNLMSVCYGRDGLSLIKSERPEIIILDLNLPDIPGLKVCREIRRFGVKAPILVLSGDSSISSKLALFSAGADDYIVKPFSLGELEARLKAIARRANIFKQTNPSTSSIRLDRASESVIRENSLPISLRHKEYAVLEYLIKNAGQAVSRDRLIAHVWRDSPKKPWSNSIDVHVNSLRDKIDRPFDRQLISTVHGIGYRLEDG